MIIEGGHTKCAWGLQLFAIVFGWLVYLVREILLTKGETWLLPFIFLLVLLQTSNVTILSQNCDVDFPGTSNLNYSTTCGGGSSDNLSLGKNVYLDDNDVFTFDSPATINIQGSLNVFAQGDGRIVIPVGVTVIVDGNMQLDAKNGGCESANPCTVTLVVHGALQIAGNLQNSLISLLWEGTGTVEIKNTFENSSNGCMSCGVTCPDFLPGAGGCKDSGVGCSTDFCVSQYSKTCNNDIIPPTISNCPADTIIFVTDCANSTVSWTPPIAADNCNVAFIIGSHTPGEIFGLGITIVIYSTADDNGNTATCSFEVKLIDNTDPVISGCPTDIVRPVANSKCEALVNWTPPTASDNCNLASFTSSHNSGDTFPLGQTTVTYTATDEGGNSVTCSFRVTIEDQQDPQIDNCPADLQVFNFDPGEDVAIVNWTEPVVSDNCAIYSFTSTHKPGHQFFKGVSVVTYSAFDEAGNESICSFIIEVLGNSPPLADDLYVQTNGTNPVKVCLDASDKDGDGIILTDVNYNLAAGLLDQLDPNQLCFVFTPVMGSFGIETIIATLCDNRNPSGCSKVKVEIEILKEKITIYKAFSPNGDAINDVWHIGNIEQYPENTVTIFDRWGSVIYEASGYNNENIVWDGRGNGRSISSTSVVPAGTYFYSVELNGPGSKSGFVELIN